MKLTSILLTFVSSFTIVNSQFTAWINEFHYDNSGTDKSEFVEIAFLESNSIDGWSLLFYNGANGKVYASQTLSTTDANSSGNGVGFVTVYQSGIQNSNEGLALVDDTGYVVQFLGYEGTVTATSGAASGLTAEDCGIRESSSTSSSQSLQLVGSGCAYTDFTWSGPSTQSIGSTNAGQTFSCGGLSPVASPTPAPILNTLAPVPSPTNAPTSSPTATPTALPTASPTSSPSTIPTVAPTSSPTRTPTASPTASPTGAPIPATQATPAAWINEFHYDNSGSDSGEFIEVAYTSDIDITAYSVVLYNGNGGGKYSTLSLSAGTSSGSTGVSVTSVSATGIQNGGPDGIALIADDGSVLEFISYEGSFTATDGQASGMTSADVGVAETSSTDVGMSLQRTGSGCSAGDFVWSGPTTESEGSVNAGQTFSCTGSAPSPVSSPTPSPIASPVAVPTASPVAQPTTTNAPVGANPTTSTTQNPLDSVMETSNSGSGSQTAVVASSSSILLGDIPSGLQDVFIQVDPVSSGADVDFRLMAGSTVIVDRTSGLVGSSGVRGHVTYGTARIEYSGWKGEQASGYGEEYIYISGVVPSDLTIEVYNQESSSQQVTIQYQWGYYESANGLTGSSLKSALHEIIDDHTEISYSAAWTALKRTDQDPENPDNVLLLYTRRSAPKAEQDTGCSCEDYWNREHVWAKSHGQFGTSMGAGTDIHALRAADKSVNTERSAKDFAEGGSTLSSSNSAIDCPLCLETDNSFDPPDSVKGSVARMIFYMATRWNGDTGSNGLTLEVLDQVGTTYGSGTSSTYGSIGKLSDLKAWNLAYPPTDEEYYRNNIVHQIQGNRNPFIDNYLLVEEIF
eukprot:Nitzschia sp. Nitz4//scaffold209_size42451//12273//14985//NITZ4_007356-RA/size42451-snap-gene-0.36-mRNA-1//1//CDS//3329541694//3318//frame0